MILFRVEDPEEKEFPYRGSTLFLGMENEGRMICDPLDLRREYLAQREHHIAQLYDGCRRHGFMMEEALTDQPLDGMLSGFLNMRAALFRR